MQRRKGRDHRNAYQDIGRAFDSTLFLQLARDAEDQRQQDDKTDLEKHRDADDEGRKGHRPRQHFVGRATEDRVGNRLGDPGIGEDLAKHRAKRNDDSYYTQGAAGAVYGGSGDRSDIQARDDSDSEGYHQQCDQWMHPDTGDDERHQQRHTAERGQQQLDIGLRTNSSSLLKIRPCRLLIDPTNNALREVGGGCLATEIRRTDPIRTQNLIDRCPEAVG